MKEYGGVLNFDMVSKRTMVAKLRLIFTSDVCSLLTKCSNYLLITFFTIDNCGQRDRTLY